MPKDGSFKVKYLTTRNLTQQGGSFYISIPKKFCDENGIGKGDPVDIYTNDDGTFIILKKHNAVIKKEGETDA